MKFSKDINTIVIGYKAGELTYETFLETVPDGARAMFEADAPDANEARVVLVRGTPAWRDFEEKFFGVDLTSGVHGQNVEPLLQEIVDAYENAPEVNAVLVGYKRDAASDKRVPAAVFVALESGDAGAAGELAQEHDLELLFWSFVGQPTYDRIAELRDQAVSDGFGIGYLGGLQKIINEHLGIDDESDEELSPQEQMLIEMAVEKSMAEFDKALDEIDADVAESDKQFRRGIEASVDRLRDQINSRGWGNLRVNLTNRDRALFVLLVAVLAVVPYWLATAAFRPPTPVYSPEIQISAADIVQAMATERVEFDPDTGIVVSLPEPAEDPDVWAQACTDLYTARSEHRRHWACDFSTMRDRCEILQEARLLVNDPEHQICTFFDGEQIQRYREWVHLTGPR